MKQDEKNIFLPVTDIMKRMTHDQLSREMNYRFGMMLARCLSAADILSCSDMKIVKRQLQEKYPPVWSDMT